MVKRFVRDIVTPRGPSELQAIARRVLLAIRCSGHLMAIGRARSGSGVAGEVIDGQAKGSVVIWLKVWGLGGDGGGDQEHGPGVVRGAASVVVQGRPVDPGQIAVEVEHDAAGELIEHPGSSQKHDGGLMGPVTLNGP
jgi:hypothetical protein